MRIARHRRPSPPGPRCSRPTRSQAVQRQGPDRVGGGREDLAGRGRGHRRRVAGDGRPPQRVPLHHQDVRPLRAEGHVQARSATRTKANGGVQFRTKRIPKHHEVSGYQADIGQEYWGALYDESRRNKVLAGPKAEDLPKIVKPDDWNEYRIRAEGPHIQLWLNGTKTVDYTEDGPEGGTERGDRPASPRRRKDEGAVQGHRDRGAAGAEEVTLAKPRRRPSGLWRRLSWDDPVPCRVSRTPRATQRHRGRDRLRLPQLLRRLAPVEADPPGGVPLRPRR